MMDRITEKNRNDWNLYSAEYMRRTQSPETLKAIMKDPACSFVPEVWEIIRDHYPSFSGLNICVPSCGDCHAVYSFAILGAHITACDFSENQLNAAMQSAQRMRIADRIRFVCTDTMALDQIPDQTFDMVYTSRGVFVWLNNLKSMFQNVYRVLKPQGSYVGCDIHPFRRPFDEEGIPVKSYDATGPFEDQWHVNFHWRTADLLNAVIASQLRLDRIAEITDSKDSLPLFPKWLCFCAHKEACIESS